VSHLRKTTQFEVIPLEEVLRIAVPIYEHEPAEDPPAQDSEQAPDLPDEEGK
jgi:hypothetical protein